MTKMEDIKLRSLRAYNDYFCDIQWANLVGIFSEYFYSSNWQSVNNQTFI